MGEFTDQLLGYTSEKSCYELPYKDIRDLQVAAMNERLQEKIDIIKLVKHLITRTLFRVENF